MRTFIRKFKSVNVMASLALCMSLMAANSRCMYILHQPELPDAVKKLRKF